MVFLCYIDFFLIAALDDARMTDTIFKGQALARKRIMLYLTVFLGISLSSKCYVIVFALVKVINLKIHAVALS